MPEAPPVMRAVLSDLNTGEDPAMVAATKKGSSEIGCSQGLHSGNVRREMQVTVEVDILQFELLKIFYGVGRDRFGHGT